MVRCTELLLPPECYDEISCDDTGLCPVLRVRQCQVWEVHTCIFHWQTGDPPPWDTLSHALEEVGHEVIPECLIDWYKGVPDFGGDPLHEGPLLLD